MPFVKDPVRAKDRAEVYRRDGGCIAPLVDRSAGPCRDGLGRVISRSDPRGRTIDHVPPKLGATRISKPRWMVWLCRGHHAHPSYWETAHRQEERDYLARKYGDLSMDLIIRVKLDRATDMDTDMVAGVATNLLQGPIPEQTRNQHIDTVGGWLAEALAADGILTDENEDFRVEVE